MNLAVFHLLSLVLLLVFLLFFRRGLGGVEEERSLAHDEGGRGSG